MLIAYTAVGGCSAGLAVGLMIGNLASVLDSPDFEAQIALALPAGGIADELSMAKEKGTLGGAMPAGAIAGAIVGFWMIDAVDGSVAALCCAAAVRGEVRGGECWPLQTSSRKTGPATGGLRSRTRRSWRRLNGCTTVLTEMAPRELRGVLGASYQLAITSGIFSGACLDSPQTTAGPSALLLFPQRSCWLWRQHGYRNRHDGCCFMPTRILRTRSVSAWPQQLPPRRCARCEQPGKMWMTKCQRSQHHCKSQTLLVGHPIVALGCGAGMPPSRDNMSFADGWRNRCGRYVRT